MQVPMSKLNAGLRSLLVFSQSQKIWARQYAECGGGSQKKGLVIGAYDGCAPGELKFTETAKVFDQKSNGKMTQLVQGGVGISRGTAQVFSNLGDDFYSVAVAGLGSEGAGFNNFEMLDECKENIRWAAGTGARALQETGITTVMVEGFTNAEAAAEGANLAVWQYQDLMSPANHKPTITLGLYENSDTEGWQRGLVKGECQNLARRLEETPGNLMTPTIFAQWAVDSLCDCGVQVDARDRGWLEVKRMNALMVMAKGSCEEPILLEMGYCGAAPEAKPIVLVTKGVTYDSGGLCLKECTNLHTKYGDLAGAAVGVGVIKLVAQMALPINLRIVAPLMESMIGGSAVKPGDVITAMNGKTIRIDDPDNEGRVSMMDALLYSHNFYPCLLGTVASCTRYTSMGIGTAATPVWSTSNDVYREFERAGSETGDRVWRLPFWKYYDDDVTNFGSHDLNNVGQGKGGYPCCGAAFVKDFVDHDLDFFHMDIHGTGLKSEGVGFPYLRKNLFTGRPTRTIAQFIYQVACPHDKGDDC